MIVAENDIGKNTIQNKNDSLREVLGIKDSINIIKEDYIQGSIAFIDFNKNSKYHAKLINRLFGHFDTAYYKTSYLKQLNKQGAPKTINIPEDIRKKWIRLYKYEGKYYIYYDCNFQMVYETTDSTFDAYPMDGADPSLIISFERQNSVSKISTYNGSEIVFEPINKEKSIYI